MIGWWRQLPPKIFASAMLPLSISAFALPLLCCPIPLTNAERSVIFEPPCTHAAPDSTLKRDRQMKRAFCAIVTLCGLVALTLLHALHAQVPAPQPFSADFTNIVAPRATVTGKIYSSPPLLRIDVSINGNESWDGIFSGGTLSYVLWPARQLYEELHVDRETDPAAKAI